MTIEQTLNIGNLVTIHEITYISGRDEGQAMIRVACTGQQARDLAQELEDHGWLIKSIVMAASMDFASAINYVASVGSNKLAESALQ